MTDRIEAWALEHGATAGRVLGILGILCAIAALSVCSSGCSGGMYRAHAQAITVTSGGLAVAGTVADTARDTALDAVEAEAEAQRAESTAAIRGAHPAQSAELLAALEIEAARWRAERTAALEAEAARWRPLGIALDAGRSALLVWAEALRMAHLAGTTDADLVAMLAPVAARVLLLYDQIAGLLTALDVDGVPALPAVVRSLVTTIGGAR